MLPYRANIFAIGGIAVFFLCVIGYAYFEARNVIYGPSIEVSTTPRDAIVHDQLLLIKGVAENITEIQMNGRPIPTTEAGAFEEAHLLAAGYNAILLMARDKIGRTTTKNIEVVYEPPAAGTSTEDVL